MYRRLSDRRIVRRAVMVVAVSVLLLASYLSSWLGLWWLQGRGWIDPGTFVQVNDSVFSPVQWWMQSEYLGSESLFRWYNDAGNLGHDAWVREYDREQNARAIH